MRSKTKTEVPATVDEYLDALPNDQRTALENVRKIIVASAPGVEQPQVFEGISEGEEGWLVQSAGRSETEIKDLVWCLTNSYAVAGGRFKLFLRVSRLLSSPETTRRFQTGGARRETAR